MGTGVKKVFPEKMPFKPEVEGSVGLYQMKRLEKGEKATKST